jgi:hypothetical protein
MTTYRIVPNHKIYKVQAVKPNGEYRIVGAWRTEEAAVSQLRKLQGEADRADYKPAPGDPRWQPRQPASGR